MQQLKLREKGDISSAFAFHRAVTKAKNQDIYIQHSNLNQLQTIHKSLPPPALFKTETKAYTVMTGVHEYLTMIKCKHQNLLVDLLYIIPDVEDILDQIKNLGIKVIDVCQDTTQEYQAKVFETRLKKIEDRGRNFTKTIKQNEQKLKQFSPEERLKMQELYKEALSVLPYREPSSNNENGESNDIFDQKIFAIQQRKIQLMEVYSSSILQYQNEVASKQAEVENLTCLQNQRIQQQESLKISMGLIQEENKLLQKQISNQSQDFDNEVKGYLLKIKEKKASVLNSQETESKGLNEFKIKIGKQMKKILFNIFGSSDVQQDAKAPKNQLSFHLIFVLDESGSMSYDFPHLTQAVQDILQIRRKHNKDKVTMIQFASMARQTYFRTSISQQFKMEMNGGGTSFTEAFLLAKQAYQQTDSNEQPILIFMTDGQASYDESAKIMTEIYNESVQKCMPLWTFVVGFSDFDHKALQTIAMAGNGNAINRKILNENIDVLFQCKDSNALKLAFKKIGKMCNDFIDSRTALLETQKQRLEELYQYIQEQQESSLQRAVAEFQKYEEGSKIFLQSSTNLSNERIEEIKNKIDTNTSAYSKLDHEILILGGYINDHRMKIKQLNNEISKVNKDLEKSGLEKKLEELKDKATLEQTDIENREEIKKNQQSNGFSGQTQETLDLIRPMAMQIFEMPSEMEKLASAIQAKFRTLALGICDIVEDMKDIQNNQNEKTLLSEICIGILKEKGVMDSGTMTTFDSTHMQLLIEMYLEQFKISEKHIIEFFQSKIIDPAMLMKEEEKEKEEEKNEQFKEEEIVPFASQFISYSPLNPDKILNDVIKKLKGSIEEQMEILETEQENEEKNGNLSEIRESAYQAKMISLQRQEISEKLADKSTKMAQKKQLKEEDKQLQNDYDEITVDQEKKVEFSKLVDRMLVTYKQLKFTFTNRYHAYQSFFFKNQLYGQFEMVNCSLAKDLKNLKKHLIRLNEDTNAIKGA